MIIDLDARGNLLANGRCLRPTICPRLFVGWTSSGQQSQPQRSLYDCPNVPVGPEGLLCRVVVATHPASKKKSRVGVTRSGLVYELFFTHLQQQAFTAVDVVKLYLHRGTFASVRSDEDQEIDPDR